jgi:hypothetical protein
MATQYSDWLDQADSYSEVSTEQVDINIREIIAALRVDPEIFIEFFLNEQLDMPVPAFHGEIWGLLTDQQKERILLAIPRDHAKTTLAKLAAVWYFLFTPHRFCVYLSNTNAIAKGACKDIIGFLKCANFVSVFGEVKWVKESENESLWIFDMTLPGGRVKRCILRAIGQGQQMRGINIDNQRPDIAIVDDVEDNDNTGSETLQKNLDKWIFGPFLKALARKKKIIWLGNMLSKTSLLARLSRMPRWNPVVFGALVKSVLTGKLEPLWPGKWTVESLKEDFKEYKDNGLIETWMCEMMNMPGHGENGFTLDQINYRPQPTPDDVLCAWITVDPAFGLKKHNDETAIAVHAILRSGGCPITVSIYHGRIDEHDMFMEVLRLAEYWNAWTWGIESVAAQKVLVTLFELLLAARQLKGRALMIPLRAGSGDPKLGRIKSFISLMAKKEWALHEDDMDATTQIVEFDFRKKEQPDDIIDACAYGPTMMQEYLPVIQAQAAGFDMDIESEAQYGMEVSHV